MFTLIKRYEISIIYLSVVQVTDSNYVTGVNITMIDGCKKYEEIYTVDWYTFSNQE